MRLRGGSNGILVAVLVVLAVILIASLVYYFVFVPR